MVVYVFDFGSQYTLLIARALRKLNVYCEVHLPNPEWFSDLKNWHGDNKEELLKDVDALVFSGGPSSMVGDESKEEWNYLGDFLKWNRNLGSKGIPILGICFGAQLMASFFGGVTKHCGKREFGEHTIYMSGQVALSVEDLSVLDVFQPAVTRFRKVWMSHNDTIHLGDEETEGEGEELIHPIFYCRGDLHGALAVFKIKGEGHMYGYQFHPEVSHTPDGDTFWLNTFLQEARVRRNWYPSCFVEKSIMDIRKIVGEDKQGAKILVACSGGVDSSVMATLLHKAVGNRCVAVFLNNGLLRKGEYEEVMQIYQKLGLNIIGVDCRESFYSALKGVKCPEIKRKVIGRVFIEEFIKVVKAEGSGDEAEGSGVKYLAQGTIYPDIVESHGNIKSHHNVGGLPEKFNLELVEPLRYLFKDEVREIGRLLGLGKGILMRHPFPGPGLAIRILGEVTEEKVKKLQEADAIFMEALRQEVTGKGTNHEKSYYDMIWQAGTILTDSLAVGVMGDQRTHESVVALRAVNSVNGMTADVFDFPMSFLKKVSTAIVNNVIGVNRVVYDITSKPPGTIEWE